MALTKQVFVEVWQRRELAWILFRRDLMAQFRQSYLGYLWLLLTPLLTTLVWLFLSSQRIVSVQTDVPYPAFVLTGTVVWACFASGLQAPLDAFRRGLPVFTKLNVPFEAFVVAGAAQAFLNFIMGSLLLIPMLWYYGIPLARTAWLYPVGALVLMAMGTGIGLLITPLGALYEDVSKGLTAAISLLMFSVPVVYPIPKSSGALATLLDNNPLTPALSLSRDALLTGSLVWLAPTLRWGAACLAEILFALIILRVAKPHMIARMGM